MNWLLVIAGAWLLVAPLTVLLVARTVRLAERHARARPLPNVVMDPASAAVPGSTPTAGVIAVARPDDYAPVAAQGPGRGRARLR